MTLDIAIAIIMTIVIAATPVLLAALGELVVEKAGVLNLGVEGMMLCGAVTGFAVTALTGSLFLGFLAALVAGCVVSMLFAVLTLALSANQVATGLALTIFGVGLSSLFGKPFIGRTVGRLEAALPDTLARHDVLKLVFGYDLMVYLTIALTLAVLWFLNRTRSGLILRAIGENDHSAHAIGHPVLIVRYAAIGFGGALAGLAGAYFSLALTPMWSDGLTAGRGWIALALVVFSSWKPLRLMLGAYLFGAVMTLELHAKATGSGFLAPEFLAMMPYIATILVLTLIAMRSRAGSNGAPACLGKPFTP